MSLTHEYESGVQILVVLLHELFVVLLSLLAVVFEEPSPVILLSGYCVLFPAARGPERDPGQAQKTYPSAGCPPSLPLPFNIRPTPRSWLRSRVRDEESACGTWKPYGGRESWGESSDRPEFRRFLDLRIEYQTVSKPEGVCTIQHTLSVFDSGGELSRSQPHSPDLSPRLLVC